MLTVPFELSPVWYVPTRRPAELRSVFARHAAFFGGGAGYPPTDFGLEPFAAFKKSMPFATFSTDTMPAPDRRATISV